MEGAGVEEGEWPEKRGDGKRTGEYHQNAGTDGAEVGEPASIDEEPLEKAKGHCGEWQSGGSAFESQRYCRGKHGPEPPANYWNLGVLPTEQRGDENRGYAGNIKRGQRQ